MKEIFGIAALTLSIGANIPYIIEIIKGQVKPERISWFLWTLLGLTYYFSALFSDGATLFTFGELIGPVIILILALKFGVGGRSRFDLISLTVALVAFVLLFVVEGVLIGLLLALIIDGIGAMLTIRKLLIDPSSESKWFWGIGAVSGVLAVISLETYNVETLLFPLYVVILSTFIFIKAKPMKTKSPSKIRRL
ncbi:MAG: hypothetical protein WAV04_01855 [Candidatus Microsaccharimonas sp.]